MIRSRTFCRFLGLSLGAITPLVASGQAAPGFVYETETEFQALADVNGDGQSDLVVVDKATGQFRIAAASSDGTLAWRSNPADSGLGSVTGFSAGPVLRPDRDALLFAEPLANRIQVVDTPEDSRLTEPLRIPARFVGPSSVTAINISGGAPGYDSDFLDIVYHATLHDPDFPNIVSSLRNAGGTLPFEEFDEFSEPNPTQRPNRILLEAGNDVVYGAIESQASSSAFNLYDPSSSPLSILASVAGLPGNVAYVYADFNGDGRAQFVFFTPGSSTIYESMWNGSGLAAATSFTYPEVIDDIRVIESAGQPQLLIVYNGGTDADRVAYDSGGDVFVEESFNSPTGEVITGAVSIGEKLHLVTGGDSKVSQSTLTYDFGGTAHTLADKQQVTPLKAIGQGSSVLLFNAPPLTNPDATLLSRVDAGPWTSAFTLSGGDAEVVSELYRGPAQGLGDEETITVSNTPPSTGGGLTNQVADDLSLRFHENPVGHLTAQLSIEPPGGTYSRAVRPILTLNGGAAGIYYRTTQQPSWTHYASNPPVITTDTVLYAVAPVDSSSYSNVIKVEYTFTGASGNRDSNGNGLPDFVAQAHGLDPLAEGHDSDGDGFTDFQEVLAGTNPLDSSSKPSRAAATFEYPNSFDLAAAPAIPDPGAGSGLLRSFSEGGLSRPTQMTVHQPNGFYLGGALTANTTHLADPAAFFSALDIVDSDLFVIATTEANFPVDDGASKDYGRQVAAIVTIPELDFEPFTYEEFGVHGGYDDLAAEAAAWRTAAVAYYESLERETVTADPVGPESTLSLLLVEKILGELLLARDLTDRSNISLTPFRANENPLAPTATEDPVSDRNRSVTLADLLALQRSSGDSTPSYKMEEIIGTVQQAVAAASGTNIQQLIELANRLYTTSATNTQPGSLRQPLDALRRFIQTGNLDNTGYDKSPASSSFPSSLLAEAAQGISEIEALIQERTVQTIAIYYDGTPLDPDCPVWKEVIFSPGTFDPDNPTLFGTEYALVDDQGRPFPMARAFPLTAGSVFEVTGFVETTTPCGDIALEVIPQPELLFLHNASPSDHNGDLIPDAIQELLADAALSPFADTDGDGYSDLQEILSGADPTDSRSIPTDSGTPAPVVDLSPPSVQIDDSGSGSSRISFHFPADFVPYIDFQLYSSEDLHQFHPTGLKASHTSGGNHELNVLQSGDAEFYIFRMSLK